MIRFDTVLDFSVVGFISEISRALADADISILSISTYKTDAVLVHESRFDDAVNAVKRALITLNFTHLAQHTERPAMNEPAPKFQSQEAPEKSVQISTSPKVNRRWRAAAAPGRPGSRRRPGRFV
ncbi:MAG: ACT domain-containing protein [Acidobacteria bacterium]|nr:ACT domain-containing protein [Acidobacteriota bacterium]